MSDTIRVVPAPGPIMELTWENISVEQARTTLKFWQQDKHYWCAAIVGYNPVTLVVKLLKGSSVRTS